MNRFLVLVLTTLISLTPSRLPAQAPSLQQGTQFGLPAVCNNGKIPFSVARASRDSRDMGFGSNQWAIYGWYNVDPGTCTEIGGSMRYTGGGLFGEDSVTLLGFAFLDSKGAWRGIKVRGSEGWFYPIDPPNQQLCVIAKEFHYTKNSPKQIDLARQCDAAAGYTLIPASFMYKGSSRVVPLVGGPDDSPDYVYVTIGPDDRATTSGHPIGSTGITHGLGGAGNVHSEASPSLCGKLSCWISWPSD